MAFQNYFLTSGNWYINSIISTATNCCYLYFALILPSSLHYINILFTPLIFILFVYCYNNTIISTISNCCCVYFGFILPSLRCINLLDFIFLLYTIIPSSPSSFHPFLPVLLLSPFLHFWQSILYQPCQQWTLF